MEGVHNDQSGGRRGENKNFAAIGLQQQGGGPYANLDVRKQLPRGHVGGGNLLLTRVRNENFRIVRQDHHGAGRLPNLHRPQWLACLGADEGELVRAWRSGHQSFSVGGEGEV